MTNPDTGHANTITTHSAGTQLIGNMIIIAYFICSAQVNILGLQLAIHHSRYVTSTYALVKNSPTSTPPPRLKSKKPLVHLTVPNPIGPRTDQ